MPPRCARWLDEQSPGRWNDLLREAVAEYADETGEGETPVEHFIEWLAEWGRDARDRQRGLLLSTAHRAKGLEFDHVIVLDGGWQKRNSGEDRDASRRLVYVAMTRARANAGAGANGERCQSVCRRIGTPVKRAAPRKAGGRLAPPFKRVREFTRREMDFNSWRDTGGWTWNKSTWVSPADMPRAIRYTARSARSSRAMRWSSALRRNPPRTTPDGSCSTLPDVVWAGCRRSSNIPGNERCRRASVFAVVQWSKEQSEPEFHDSIRCDREWEVVIPELVFLPDD